MSTSDTFNALSFDPDLGIAGVYDPVALARMAAQRSMPSRRYIRLFQAADTAPITVTDAASQGARDRQVILICRRICAEQTRNVADAQVLAFHTTLLKGWF